MSMLTFKAAVKDINADTGEFVATASAPTVDRDGEVIDAGALTWKTPTVPIHVNHSFRVEDLVGRGRPYYDGSVLRIEGKFAGTPRAQEVRQLVLEGILDSVSVGFMQPKRRRGKDGVDHITSAELLEVSFVSVPSNRESQLVSARNYRDRTMSAAGTAAWVSAMKTLTEAEIALLDTSPEVRRADRASDKHAQQVLRDAEQLLRRLNRRR